MDDNIKKLVDEMLDMQEQLTEYKMREKELIKYLWNEEILEAKSMEGRGSYNRELEDSAFAKISEIRNIFGIMPCPEALNILKAAREDVAYDAD